MGLTLSEALFKTNQNCSTSVWPFPTLYPANKADRTTNVNLTRQWWSYNVVYVYIYMFIHTKILEAYYFADSWALLTLSLVGEFKCLKNSVQNPDPTQKSKRLLVCRIHLRQSIQKPPTSLYQIASFYRVRLGFFLLTWWLPKQPSCRLYHQSCQSTHRCCSTLGWMS